MQISMEFVNIFRNCASKLGTLSPGRQEILMQCIDNTQLHNVIPGSSPGFPLKTKQSHFVSRYIILLSSI